jgi:hypothetical protein
MHGDQATAAISGADGLVVGCLNDAEPMTRGWRRRLPEGGWKLGCLLKPRESLVACIERLHPYDA